MLKGPAFARRPTAALTSQNMRSAVWRRPGRTAASCCVIQQVRSRKFSVRHSQDPPSIPLPSQISYFCLLLGKAEVDSCKIYIEFFTETEKPSSVPVSAQQRYVPRAGGSALQQLRQLSATAACNGGRIKDGGNRSGRQQSAPVRALRGSASAPRPPGVPAASPTRPPGAAPPASDQRERAERRRPEFLAEPPPRSGPHQSRSPGTSSGPRHPCRRRRARR